MRVNNQTSDPVDWEQTGGMPPNEEYAVTSQKGHLEVGEESPEFTPSGEPPYRVVFIRAAGTKPERMAEAGGIHDAGAQVIVTTFPLVV